MVKISSQRYLNDMLIRLMNLRKCILEFDTNQLNLNSEQQILARESLIEEYQRTTGVVIAELDEYLTTNSWELVSENSVLHSENWGIIAYKSTN